MGIKESKEQYMSKLLGRINYVLSVEPDNNKMKEYKKMLQKERSEI